jgi:phosphatidate cytidylyltransferase
VSAQSHQAQSPHQGHAPGFRAIRWNMDWITRPLFGAGLAFLAIFALFQGTIYFAGLTALLTIFAAHEWHRMVAQNTKNKRRAFRIETAITAVSAGLAILALALGAGVAVSLVLVALGAVAAVLLAVRQGNPPGWEALGVCYLGLPGIALVSLRAFPPEGAFIIIGLFVIVWATDTGALICGNLIGGPRIAPKLSPSKTWAGTMGGSLVAATTFTALIYYGHGVPAEAFIFSFLLSFLAHGGDLFESLVKRRFGIKNSGALIPGHGGVLDRMDSTLAVALGLAILVFAFHLDPLFGAHA